MFTFGTGEPHRGLVFKIVEALPHSFAPVGLNAEMIGFTSPDQLKITKLYDINSRGEVIEHDVSELPEAQCQEVDGKWVINIYTEIAGLNSSFEAVIDLETWTLRTAGSVRGYLFA